MHSKKDMPIREKAQQPSRVFEDRETSRFFARNSRTTSAGSRCLPSMASFMARISSAVILPDRASRAA